MKTYRLSKLTLAVASALLSSSAFADCQMPNNQMPNCAFTSDIANWTNTNAVGQSFGNLNYQPFQGNEAMGSLQFNSVFVGGNPAFRANAARCVVLVNGIDDLAASIAYKLVSGGGAVSCQLNLSRFATTDCTGSVSAAQQTLFGLNQNFTRISAAPLLLGTSASVMLDVTCSGNVVEDFTGHVDDVILADDIIFADNFE